MPIRLIAEVTAQRSTFQWSPVSGSVTGLFVTVKPLSWSPDTVPMNPLTCSSSTV